MPLKADWTDSDIAQTQHAKAHNDLAAAANAAVDVQIFTAITATWTKPPGARTTFVLCVAGGTGGGSGRRGAPGTVRQGGGGGSSGGITRHEIPSIALPDTVPVFVGQGTQGGAAVTTDDTNGNPATGPLSRSSFGTYASAGQSQTQGQGGAAGTGGGGAYAGYGTSLGSAGGSAQAAGGPGATAGGPINYWGSSGGGGAGGGITTANIANNGGAGSNIPITVSASMAGGVVDGALPTVAIDQPVNSGLPGHGGGGGAASVTKAAQDGANGGMYGAGGGGGGASTNGFNSGRGGDGAPGIVIVITHCVPV